MTFFFCYLSLYLNKSEHKKPWIKAPQRLYLLSKLFRVRNKTCLLFLEWRRFSFIKAPSVGLCQMACVFKATTNPHYICSSVLVTLNEWLVLRNKLNYTHTNVGARVQPHQPSLSMVSPTQMLKYLRFF